MRLLEAQSAGILSTGEDIEIQAGSRKPGCSFSAIGCPPTTRVYRSVRALCDEYTRRDRAGDSWL